MVTKRDLQIISCLRGNARQKITGISRETGIPATSIYDAVRRHEKRFISKYSTLLKFSELGFSTRIYAALKVEEGNKEKLRAFLQKHANINSIYQIRNRFDFLIEALFKNAFEADLFIKDVESRFPLLEREIFYIVDSIEQEKFLA